MVRGCSAPGSGAGGHRVRPRSPIRTATPAGSDATGAPHTRPGPRMRGVRNLLTGRTVPTTSPHVLIPRRSQLEGHLKTIMDRSTHRRMTGQVGSHHDKSCTATSAEIAADRILRCAEDLPAGRRNRRTGSGVITRSAAVRGSFGGHPLSDFDMAGHLIAHARMARCRNHTRSPHSKTRVNRRPVGNSTPPRRRNPP